MKYCDDFNVGKLLGLRVIASCFCASYSNGRW